MEKIQNMGSLRRGFVFTISDRACVGPHSLITLSLQAYPLLDLLPHGPLGGGAVRARGDAPSDLACGVLHLEGDLDGVRVRVRVGVRVGVRVRVRVGRPSLASARRDASAWSGVGLGRVIVLGVGIGHGLGL